MRPITCNYVKANSSSLFSLSCTFLSFDSQQQTKVRKFKIWNNSLFVNRWMELIGGEIIWPAGPRKMVLRGENEERWHFLFLFLFLSSVVWSLSMLIIDKATYRTPLGTFNDLTFYIYVFCIKVFDSKIMCSDSLTFASWKKFCLFSNFSHCYKMVRWHIWDNRTTHQRQRAKLKWLFFCADKKILKEVLVAQNFFLQ